MLPKHIRHGVKEYIEKGFIPGGFLQAVICNDLSGAFQRADSTNTERMKDIVQFFHWWVPAPVWGSKEKMEAHAKAKQEEREARDN
jgi:hypothetical protein